MARMGNDDYTIEYMGVYVNPIYVSVGGTLGALDPYFLLNAEEPDNFSTSRR